MLYGGSSTVVTFARVIPLPGKPFHPLGYLGVSLFLMLSGYGCSISLKRDSNGFLKKRLIKVMPELAAVILLTVLLQNLLGMKNYPVSEVALNMLGLSSTILRVTWYISFQYTCYVVIYLAFKYRPQYAVIALLTSSCGVLTISCFLQCDIIGLDMWGLNTFSFAIGSIFAINEQKIRETKIVCKNLMIIFLLVAFAGLFVLCYFTLGNPKELYICNPLKSLIAATFCSILYFVAETYGKWIERSLSWFGIIGAISYEVYLIHGAIIYCFPEFFQITNVWVMLPVFLAIVVSLAWILHHMSGKIYKFLISTRYKKYLK